MGAAAFKPASTTSSATTTTRYLHTDHLGGTHFVSDATGAVIEAIDYYPYGQNRVDTKVGTYTGEKRKYIGEEFDSATNLSYLNARYYNGARGNFLSEDPVFLGTEQNLEDPQALNSYAYANGNPITKSDPTGKSWQTFGQGAASPFVYAYNHPLQTAGVFALTTVAVLAAPVTVAVIGAAAGGYAIGTAGFSAYTAPNADARDYYIGQALTFTGLTAVGIKGSSSVSATKSTSRQTSGSPDFIVDVNGQVFPVPKGATGPVPVINKAGKVTGSAFTGGSGGENGQVTTMRIMDPNSSNPTGYIKYTNANKQGVNPNTGKTGTPAETHYPANTK